VFIQPFAYELILPVKSAIDRADRIGLEKPDHNFHNDRSGKTVIATTVAAPCKLTAAGTVG
jgi:hypothetical protein